MTNDTNSVVDGSPDNLYHVGSADDIEPGDRVLTEIEGIEVGVFNVKGEYQAIANFCVHQGGPVAEGLVSGSITCEMTDDDWELTYDEENELVACPWHGWQFDISSGKHTATTDHRIPTFDVVNRDGELYVQF